MRLSKQLIDEIRKCQRLAPGRSATSDYLESWGERLQRPSGSVEKDPDGARALAKILPRLAALLRNLDAAAKVEASLTPEQRGKSPASAPGSASAPQKKKKGIEPPATTSEWQQPIKSAKVHIDGGSKGNPGPASGGIVFSTMTGQTLHEVAVAFDGELTNNAAEYLTLIRALEIAADRGIENLYAFSDSELVVKQIGGQYKVKNANMARLAAQVQKLRGRFKQFSLVAIPREQNKRADELANYALKPSS